MTQTRKIKDLPVIPAIDDADEVIVRDVSASDPAQAVTKTTIAALREAMGGGGDASTWSQYPATQDVDMDGHDVVGLPTYSGSSPPADLSAAASFATLANAMTEAIAAWATAPASQDVDMDGHKITGLGAPSASDDAATKQYVDTVAGAAPTKIENGTSKVEIPSSGGDVVVTVSGQVIATFSYNGQTIIGSPFGGRLYLPADSGHLKVRSGGYTSDCTSAGYLQFPSGVASYMHGIHIAKSAADDIAAAKPRAETLSWSGVTNVDSVSHVEASIKEEGGYVDIDAVVLVTPVATGITRAEAILSGLAPKIPRAGTASASDNVTVAPAACGAVPSGGDAALTVTFDAQSTDSHMVSVRIRYEVA